MDSVLQSLPDEVRREFIMNPEALETFIKYHVIPGGELSTRLLRSGQQYDTMSNSKLTIKDYYSVSGLYLVGRVVGWGNTKYCKG